ncbi:hypothetical protein ACWEQ7_11145 [Streptomyces sp. NPDC004069]
MATVAARQIGLNGIRTQEITDLLRNAAQSTDPSLSAAAAVAHYQLTGDADVPLRAFKGLLSARGQTHWYLSSLQLLGSAAAPLLPLIEPLLEVGYEWTRMAAAETHHQITGSPDRAVPDLVELVGLTPVGLRALQALAATGQIPEELRSTLRAFFFSPLRLLSDAPSSGWGHPDEELRTLARTLLTVDQCSDRLCR